jgi:hypothetical protein
MVDKDNRMISGHMTLVFALVLGQEVSIVSNSLRKMPVSPRMQ